MSKFNIRIDQDFRTLFVKLINSIVCTKTHKHFMDIISKKIIDEHETEQLIKFIAEEYEYVLSANEKITVNKFIRNINVLKIIFQNHYLYIFFLGNTPNFSFVSLIEYYNNAGMVFTSTEYYSILKYISKYEKELEHIPQHIKKRLAKMKTVKKAIIRGELK